MKKSLVFIFALSVLFGCTKTEPVVLTASPDKLEFGAAGGSSEFVVDANFEWTAKTDGQDWYSISPQTGTGHATVKVTVQQHIKSAVRSGSISIISRDKKISLPLIQASPAVPSEAEKVSENVGFAGGEIKIAAPSGYEFKVIVPEDMSWLTVLSSNQENIVLKVTENPGRSDRKGEISVTTTDNKPLKSISFVQYGTAPKAGELLIEEIFFQGNKIGDTKYNDATFGDQYFILTNNSDHAFYADGVLLLIGEILSGAYKTNVYFIYPPQDDFLGASDLFAIPGSGKDVLLDAGKSLVIAIAAQNFKEKLPETGCDLTKADFEIYEESNPGIPQKDTDNPDVPNMVVWRKKSMSYTILHQRGFYGYALALPPEGMTAETFLKDYKWNDKKVFTLNKAESQIDAYKVPQAWALDAVNLSRKECFVVLPWNEKMDAGYTYCGKSFNDNPWGTCVKRKKLENGKLQDTNNSTNDFLPEYTPPSLR